MDKYQSHKVVEAGKIEDINTHDRTVTLLSGEIYQPGEDWWKRYEAATESWDGGYLVVYDGGYESWSPKKAFEEGYSPA